MIEQTLDPVFVQRQIDALRAAIADGALDDAAAEAVDALPRVTAPDATAPLLAALPVGGAGPASSGGGPDEPDVPFMGRDPIAAMLQTAIEERVRAEHPDAIEELPLGDLAAMSATPAAIATMHESDQFTTTDIRWVTEVGKAVLKRLAKGNHRFNRMPAEIETARDDARVVLVGDWGSGLPRARAVAAHMAEEVRDAVANGREVHVIHLGDVYYSGERSEYDNHVLGAGLWPVTAAQAAAGVGSWSLNGNHDMYSGGWAYYDHLLAEPRFAMQRSPDGKGASYFRIRTPSWDVVGLDTAWDADPLAMGHRAVLEDPQAEFVGRVAVSSNRKLLLLSHHQFVSVYSPHDIGKILPSKLASLLAARRITAWFWGHEHRCMGFEDTGGVAFPRCVGHGGVPVLSRPEGAPTPPPGIWEERGFLDDRGRHWARFGFAVLDFQGAAIHVRYRNDLGAETREEDIG
jgi:hypothetical protein